MGHLNHTRPMVVVSLLITILLSGCIVEESSKWPPVFSLDHVEHWFEGDRLVVNLTFTNQANFTPGLIGRPPRLEISLWEWAATDGDTRPGEEVEQAGFQNFRVIMEVGERAVTKPWQKRWSSQEERSGMVFTGPIEIPPGASQSLEIEFLTKNKFISEEGLYSIHVEIFASRPEQHGSGRLTENIDYMTGCFNPDVAEFYGVRDPGLDCTWWNCNREYTHKAFVMEREMGKPKAEYIPACDATDAVGPHYY